MEGESESRILAWTERIWNHKISIRVLIFPLCAALVLTPYLWFRLQHKDIVHSIDSGQEGLGVHELITKVKSELQQTDDERRIKGEAALFRVKDFDLEVNFLIHKDVSAKGDVNYHLVAIGSDTKIAFERTQKITLHLTALPPPRIEGVSTPSTEMNDVSHISLENAPPPTERRKP